MKSQNHYFFRTADRSYLWRKNACRENERVLAVEYLPGQYDQRADSCAQCIQLLSGTERPDVRVANVIVLEGNITDEDYERIKSYCINPVESREASLDKPHTLREEQPVASDVETIRGFIAMDNNSLQEIARQNGFAMSFEDLIFCRDYFRDTEKRDPTITELKWRYLLVWSLQTHHFFNTYWRYRIWQRSCIG